MGNFQVTLPDDLHWRLKARACDEHLSLRALVFKALEEYLQQHPPEPPKSEGKEVIKSDNPA